VSGAIFKQKLSLKPQARLRHWIESFQVLF